MIHIPMTHNTIITFEEKIYQYNIGISSALCLWEWRKPWPLSMTISLITTTILSKAEYAFGEYLFPSEWESTKQRGHSRRRSIHPPVPALFSHAHFTLFSATIHSQPYTRIYIVHSYAIQSNTDHQNRTVNTYFCRLTPSEPFWQLCWRLLLSATRWVAIDTRGGNFESWAARLPAPLCVYRERRERERKGVYKSVLSVNRMENYKIIFIVDFWTTTM